MREKETRQLELGCDTEDSLNIISPMQDRDKELLRQIDKIITDTTSNVRPYLNRMVKDVERLLEGNFIRSPSSNILDDMIAGLEKDIRKFVDEVQALKRWSQPHPPQSSSKKTR